MLDNFNALYQDRPNLLTLSDTNLDLLPAKVSKRLWVNPLEFVITVNAMVIAQWALSVSQLW